MSEAHEREELDGPHEGPIKTPKQLILAVLYAFVIPIFGIVLLVMYVTSDNRPAAGSDALTPQAIADRIRPVGIVDVRDASDPTSLKTGEQVFAGQCAACHASGALGAPKLGDATAWAPRIKSGLDALVQASIAGKGQMPPQGGGDHSDFEIARAVVHMANSAGAKFAEPAPPAASGAAATTAATTATTTTAAAAGAAPSALVAPGPAMTGGSPQPDPNAGRPEATPTAALNAQVRTAPPNAVPSPPSAQVAAATAAVATTTAAAAGPPALYNQVCAACHVAGVANAPKLGDKAAWAPRIAQGIDALTTSVIKGKGAMPPKGGSSASDADIKALVTYMVSQSK